MKKILLSAACLVVVAAAGFGGYTYYENQQMDPWLKANIAALASIETPDQGESPGKLQTCYNGIHPDIGDQVWYCATCSIVLDYDDDLFSFSSYCRK